ncbi:DUF2142 domain-containing protein [Pseudomonas silesiensis]|uniref:DUF2142 domain-containing protein n=1 Tax=Pseudomonas silesiensis TaxID=1853130 RepID=UPI0034D5DF5D
MDFITNKKDQLASPKVIALLIFFVCYVISLLTPPFQSPDEINHIKRAYLLGSGKIVLDTPPGNPSGGMIDTGLLSFIKSYEHIPFHSEEKVSRTNLYESNGIEWSKKESFSEAAGTGYYFPLVYLPQAVALKIGYALSLSVADSYKLTRLFSLATLCLLLFIAFSIYSPSLLTACLLLLPMTLFQMASASLDGISTALAVFAISVFMKISAEKENSKTILFTSLILSIVLLTSSRTHLLPLLLLPFASYFYTKQRRYLFAGIAISLLVITWIIIAIKFTTDGRPEAGASPGKTAVFYIEHPFILISTIFNTITDKNMILFYAESFIGILGWLDAQFERVIYIVFFALITFAMLVSVSLEKIKKELIPRSILLICSLSAVILMFIALLLTWKTSQATIIQGVQGRYLLVPALLFSYALSTTPRGKKGKYIGIALGSFLVLYSVSTMSTLILDRYYIQPEQPKPSELKFLPSDKLSLQSPIIFIQDARLRERAIELKSVSILFATHMKINQGVARLKLSGPNGKLFETKFKLESLEDNKYKKFKLDGAPYDSAYIEFETGGGISVWQAVDNTDTVTTCAIYELTNGVKLYTKGCPVP